MILKVVRLLIKAESLDSDCLPEPPTPTSRACPPGEDVIRVILHTCLMASSNKTRFISMKLSLYSIRASLMCFSASAKASTS